MFRFQTPISGTDKSLLEKLFKADFKLYNFFKEKFRQEINSYGQRKMALAVEQLHEFEQYAKVKCKMRMVESGGKLTADKTTYTIISK